MRFRRLRWLVWTVAGLLGLAIVLALAVLLILPSTWFREQVRTRIVAEVEKASGGRVEIGSFQFDWTGMMVEIAPFVLHGTEPAGEAPLFRAESVKVGLKIVSALKRDIDIASVDIHQPRVNLLLDKNGISNIPKPKVERKSETDILTQILSLSIGEINLRNGEVHYGDRKLPLDFRGKYLNSKLLYDFAAKAYETTLTVQEAETTAMGIGPVRFAMDSKLRLLENRIEFRHVRATMKESSVELMGTLDDLSNPRFAADVVANASMAELAPMLKLAQPRTGQANFTGKLSYDATNDFAVSGRVTGQHLAFRQDRVHLQNISLASDLSFQKRDLKLRGLTVHALDGVFNGSVDLLNLAKYKVNGKLTGVSLTSLARTAGLQKANFSGKLNGPVEVKGTLGANSRDLQAGGKFNINATNGGVPVKGFVEVAYNQRRNSIQLGDSWLELPHSRLDLKGTLGELLTVKFRSSDLNELNLPAKLPIEIRENGQAVFDGSVTGPLTNPRATGALTISSFRALEENIDTLTATLDATSSSVHIQSFAAGQGKLRLSGSGDIALREWKPFDAGAISASLKVDGVQVGSLLKQRKQDIPIDGLVNATAQVSGTLGNPQASIKFTMDKPVLMEESFDRFTGDVRYQEASIELGNGVLSSGSSRLLLAGTYGHPVGDFRNGQLKFSTSTEGWGIQEFRYLARTQPGLTGVIRGKLSGTAGIKNAGVLPEVVNGDLALTGLSLDKRAVGDLSANAVTTGREVALTLAGNFRGSKLTGESRFTLSGDYPGSGEINLAPTRASTLQEFFLTSQGKDPIPITGTLEARLSFSGPAMKPELMRARLEIPQLQVSPARRSFTSKQRTELTLRNQGPLVFEYDGKALNVLSAHLVGPDTDFTATGSIQARDKGNVDVKLNGKLNLSIFQDFDPDIVSAGSATVSASVRGTLQDPQLTGRMEFKNASMYIADFPNGLDRLNGTIVFDQRRATVEKLTAQTGGGDLQLSGFVGLGRGETVYRLQARADHVRLRYPEGVSATANANLSLTGTSSKSLLSGVVTIVRAGFTMKSDVGGLLTSAAPIASPTTQSDFLRNMNLDVRLETVPSLQFTTSLTSNLQADADLRIRGTAAKPVVLGRVVVSQGEVEFFGNKYTITRGEIGFFNPVRIEPVLDIDVETRARGVQVNISLNGTLKKLNFSYRSDPPLQSNEIIALLAMGRAPGTNSSLASSQTVSSTNALTSGTNSLLGQAVANPVSDRLQRFFGVSRLKIDPQLTGLSAVPQARLTIEQQVSRDITLTYVTNLAQANQQIIRVEWNLNKTWSVVAVREENGVFGVDFFFKKRFR